MVLQTSTKFQKDNAEKQSIKPTNSQIQIKFGAVQQAGGESKRNYWKEYLKTFCQRSAIHGIGYLAEENIHKYEKLFWALILILGIYGSIHICLVLSATYQRSVLRTVLLSSSFPVYIIQYPAVVLCSSNRLNWLRLDEAKNRFLPKNRTIEMENLFEKFFSKFESLKFGDFKKFRDVQNDPLQILDSININEVVSFMSLECEEVFYGECWWRNTYRNCCEIFGKQNGPAGYCFVFNSLLNEAGIKLQQKIGVGKYPYKTSSAGPLSGLQASVYFNTSYKRPKNKDRNGFQLGIQDPDQWAGSFSSFIPLQTEAYLRLQPVLFHAMNDTKKIHSEVRQCLFSDEGDQNAKSLPGELMRYSFEDCFAECQRKYTGKLCNCTVEVFHPIGDDYPPCKPSNFRCLFQNMHIFRFTKNFEEDKYIDNNGSGMACSCLRFCYSLRLGFDMDYDSIFEANLTNVVTFDVSYDSETMPYYKTELVMSWLDLLVSFGGIAGLFLGSSLITVAEIIYHFTIGLILYWRKIKAEEAINFYNQVQWAKRSNTQIKY